MIAAGAATPEFVEQIKAREASLATILEPLCSYCDPAGKGTNAQTARSELNLFARSELRPVGKTSTVRDGCVRIMDLLADKERPLIVASRCKGLVRALSQVKPKRSDHKVYEKRELFAHPIDALRYLLVNVVPDADQRVSWDANAPSSFETEEEAGQRSLMAGPQVVPSGRR